MKKTLALLTAAIMLFSMLTLTSCKLFSKNEEQKRNGKTAKETYLDAVGDIYSSDSFSFVSTRIISIVEGNELRQVTETVTIKLGSGENAYIKIQASDSKESFLEAWYKDGMMYSSSAEGKFKAQISYDEFNEAYMNGGGMLDIPEKWLKKGEFYENGDGSFGIAVNVDGTEYFTKYKSTMNYLNADAKSTDDAKYQLLFSSDGTLNKVVITAYGRDSERSCSTHTTWSVFDIDGTDIPEPDGTFIDVTDSI